MTPLGRGGRPLRIAYGRIFHEANAFSPLLTTREDFERMHLMRGDALRDATRLRGKELVGYLAHAELTGFVQAARLAGGVTAVPLLSALAVSGGPIERRSFESLVDEMLVRLRGASREGALDGVYLALHGSMEVDGLDEAPEAYVLQRVRAVLQGEAKIAVSYDLHANLSRGTVEPADVLIGYRTNPHWDLAPTGFRAGNRLIRALRGEVSPVSAWRKLPLVLGGGMTIDFLAPMRKIFRYMRKLEDDPRILSASLFMVHPYTSAENLGWSVHVTTDGDEALAAKTVDALADRVWAVRDVALPPMKSAKEALDEISRSAWRHLGPVSIVDVDDVVGAGAPGGNTRIVQAMLALDRKLVAYVPVHDPEAVQALAGETVGSKVKVVLRGTPGYDQPLLRFTATLAERKQTDFGETLRLDVIEAPGIHVAIAERPPLPIHPKFWRELGLDPRRADAIVQKNFFHYRMFYAAMSFRHVPVVTAGATSLTAVRERAALEEKRRGLPTHEWRLADPALRALARRAEMRHLPEAR